MWKIVNTQEDDDQHDDYRLVVNLRSEIEAKKTKWETGYRGSCCWMDLWGFEAVLFD